MENRQNTTINWYPGHMAKARREITEKLSLVDLVYEVIDARMPFSSQIADLDSWLGKRPRILIMTKYDLCDEKVTKLWQEYYQKQDRQVIICDLTTGKNVKEIVRVSLACREEENEKRSKKGLKPRSLRVAIVGVPNVGKSTLINQLVGRKATQTGDRPGVTKANTWIRIHHEIELLDTPGLLWPKIESDEQALTLASFSAIRDEIASFETLATFILKKMERLYPERLQERYDIAVPLSETLEEEFEQIAKKRGALQKGGVADYEKVAKIIIGDLREGRLGKVTFDEYKEV